MVEIIIETQVNSILDIPGCGAKLESEEDAAGPMSSPGNETLDVAGGAKRHGECVAEVILIRHEDPGAAL